MTLQNRPDGGELIERGYFLLTEIRAVDERVFDGSGSTEEGQLAVLRSTHDSRPAGADRLAQALYEYAGFADGIKEQIAGVGGFDVALIDEAFAVTSPPATK